MPKCMNCHTIVDSIDGEVCYYCQKFSCNSCIVDRDYYCPICGQDTTERSNADPTERIMYY